ncbi:MAG: hypothetical protein FWE87_00855 [Coriobacteriia bacterium]|nr:hypothetical protein [Coriobacteriia bacterium]
MRKLISLLIIILLVYGCVPLGAGALSNEDKDLVMVIAMQEPTGDYLLYRVFARQGASLPTSVQLKLEQGARPADVQESDGLEWWPAKYVQSGDQLTVNLTNGRIAEVKVEGGTHFTTNIDGTVTAVVPLVAQTGVTNVQPGATIPDGMTCISPTPINVNSDFSTDLLVASVFVDMSRSGAPTSMTFVFGEQGLVYTEGETAADAAQEPTHGQCCWWPLVVLCLLFGLLSLWYWIIKDRKDQVIYEVEEEPEVDEEVIVEEVVETEE